MSKLHYTVIIAVAVALTACGVRRDLRLPSGESSSHSHHSEYEHKDSSSSSSQME